jgi:hypothetical protein
MLNRTSIFGSCFLSVLVACIGGSTALAEKGPLTVVVTPARPRVVQLVQDVFRLRQMQVVSYQGTADTADPVLHKWDGRAWKRITLEEYQAALPERVVLIGDQKALPAVLIEASSRSEDTLNIQTFDVSAILEECSKLFNLSPREMTSLAKNNGVVVVDRNADLIRYGKYYPGPGFEKLRAAPKAPKGIDKGEVPLEPDLPPIKIEPSSPEQPAPAGKTPAPAITVPAPAKAKVDIAPEDK